MRHFLVLSLVVLASAGLCIGYMQVRVDWSRDEVRRNTLNVQYNLCHGAQMANHRGTTPDDIVRAIRVFFAQQTYECNIAPRGRNGPYEAAEVEGDARVRFRPYLMPARPLMAHQP
jgi:hypothetical protein